MGKSPNPTLETGSPNTCCCSGFQWEAHCNAQPYSSKSEVSHTLLPTSGSLQEFYLVLCILFVWLVGLGFFCLFVCLFGLELGFFFFLRGVVSLLQFEYDVPRYWFLVCFGIYPVWYFLTFLGLWFSFNHSNDTLFGKFLATVTSDISSACFLFFSPTGILIWFSYSFL